MIAVVNAPPITRDGGREAANHELSKGIYHRYDDPWPVRAFNAVQHWIGRLVDELGKHSPGGGSGAVALLVAIAVLLVIVRWRLGPLQRTARLPAAVLDSTVQSAAEHRRAASDAAEAGQWAEAIVERMRAIARGLEDSGQLANRPGRTADELATEVARDRPDTAPVITRAARVFDAVAYGRRDGDADGYTDVVAADDLLLSMRNRR